MKKIILVILLSNVLYSVAQQNRAVYVAYSTGINIRKTPSLSAELLGKIPYATKLSIEDNKKDTTVVIVEGMTGYWTPITYQGKKGYVLDCYLLSIVPPKKGTANMQDYIKQLTTPYGTALTLKNGTQNNITENGYIVKKQLYKNGISWHEYRAYEYGADSYFIPNITVQEAFLIVRQIKEFENAFTEKDAFPTSNKTFTKKNTMYETSYTQKVDAEDWGNGRKWVKSIELNFEEGGYSSFKIISLDTGEVLISYSSGV